MGLGGGARGGVGVGGHPGVRACGGTVRMSGTRSGPSVCGAGEAGRGARSLGSGGEGFRGTGSVRRPGARSRAHKMVRLPPNCPPGAARSNARGGASAGSRASTRSLRGGARRGERAADGGMPGRGPGGRSVEGKESAAVRGEADHSWVSSPQGSR